jgi:hypothetical protein
MAEPGVRATSVAREVATESILRPRALNYRRSSRQSIYVANCFGAVSPALHPSCPEPPAGSAVSQFLHSELVLAYCVWLRTAPKGRAEA